MNVNSFQLAINLMTLHDSRLTASAYQALYQKHRHDRTLTPSINDEIITALILLEDRITALEEKCPELPQSTYDEAIEIQKFNILTQTP